MADDNRNVLIVGSPGSGKSTAELKTLVELAEGGESSIVCIDPHPRSLAFGLLTQLVARGMEKRILYDRLWNLDIVLPWDFLKPSDADSDHKRRAVNDHRIRQFADVLGRRRGMASLRTSPLTEEWVLAALQLYVSQQERLLLPVLPDAFKPGHANLKRMVENCTDEETAERFRGVNSKSIRRGQYAAAERLIRGVCLSPAFALRCQLPGFDLERFLDRNGILIIEGGSGPEDTLSDDAMRTMMGAVILRVIQYIRSRGRSVPSVVLSLDEANNAGLIGEAQHETNAMAECRKMGLGVHVLVQLLDFPNAEITKQVMATCGRHEWFYTSSPDVARAGAADLGHEGSDATQTEYRDNLRGLARGERYVRHGNRVWRERVTALDDPWAFEGLAEAKAAHALNEVIYERPEYCVIEEKETAAEPDSDAEVASLEAASITVASSADLLPPAVEHSDQSLGVGERRQRPDASTLTWQERDELILERVRIHPCTAQHFFDLFTSETAAYRRIKRLRDSGKLQLVGTVTLTDAEKDADAVDAVKTGAARKVYCNGWRPEHLEHEVLLTDFLLLYETETDEVRRGKKVDGKILPDAELIMRGKLFYVELDTGSMSHRRMLEQRWPRYRDVKQTVLVVTSTKQRRDNLIAKAKGTAVEGIGLFTTLDEAKRDTWGAIWVDCSGIRRSLQRES